MNHSIYSADRTTHLKVVIVVVAGFSISMRNKIAISLRSVSPVLVKTRPRTAPTSLLRTRRGGHRNSASSPCF